MATRALRTLPFAESKDNNNKAIFEEKRPHVQGWCLPVSMHFPLPHRGTCRGHAMHFALLRQRFVQGWFFFLQEAPRKTWIMVSSAPAVHVQTRLVRIPSLRPLFSGVHTRMVTGGRRLSSCCGRLKDVLNLRSDSFGAFRGFLLKVHLGEAVCAARATFFRLPAFVFRSAIFRDRDYYRNRCPIFRMDLLDQVLGACRGQFQFSERPFPKWSTLYRLPGSCLR